MSPDGFVQVALNTAYYLLCASFATAYESVNTKHYNHGRSYMQGEHYQKKFVNMLHS